MDVELLKLNGVIHKENLIGEKTIKKFKKILEKNDAIGKDNDSGFFPATINSIIKSFLKFKFSKAIHGIIFRRFIQNNKFKIIADDYFNQNSKLVKIDSYISEVSDEKIIDWHTDQAYSGKKNILEDDLIDPDRVLLKFFLFLTNVNCDDGDLAYISGSHKTCYHLKKLIFKRNLKYEPHWSIKQLNDFVKKVDIKNKLLQNTELKESEYFDFLDKVSFINKTEDTKKFDKYAKAGDLMIFDEHGIHRASAPKSNTRYVIRFIFSRDNFY